MATFWATFGNLGNFFIPTSVHTECDKERTQKPTIQNLAQSTFSTLESDPMKTIL